MSKRDEPGILYIVSRFPTVTETFVVDEWWKLERRFRLEFASLLRQREPALHEPARRLLPRVSWVGPLAPATLRANVALLVRHPKLYLSTFLTLQRGSARTPMGGHLKGAYTFWKAVRLAEVVRERGVGHVHAHFVNQPASAAWVIHRLTGTPFSFTAHANDLFMGPALLERKLQDCAFAVTISDYNAAFLGRHVRGDSQVVVVHCGIEPEHFPFKERTGTRAVICVARLAETKGHADLFRAFSLLAPELPDLRLELVGDGPERERLTALAAELGISDRARFHGALPAEEVRRILAESDLFVLASVQDASGGRDGIPVSLMEAMASGLPVVTTELSGIPELVENGRTGLLVQPGDPAGLAAAIRVLVEDPEYARQLARNGRDWVGERFALETETSRLADLFEQALARRSVVAEPIL